MGCGFCVVVAAADHDSAMAALRTEYGDAKRIGGVVAGPPDVNREGS
jgi:phosphoribosylaminoimidazole (AIR) synthetase